MTFPKIEPLEARIAPATISIGDVSLPEGDAGTTEFKFMVTLSAAEADQVTVDFATAAGTATSNGPFADFIAQTGTVTFDIGETTKEITVLVNGDPFDEPTENFTVTLSNANGANTISDGPATGTIQDDDAAAAVSIANAVDVTEGAGVMSEFTISLNHAVEKDVTVTFTTGAGADSAKPAPGAFTDYLAKTGMVTFVAGGALTQQISVAITDDPFKEPTESFSVSLTNPSGATLGATATATGSILNDSDASVGLRIGDVQKVEGNADNSLTLTLTLSDTLATDVDLTLSTLNGTAVAGTDFTALTLAPVKILAGTAAKTFALTIKGDTTFEATESFFVNLNGAPAGVTVINEHPIVPSAQATARVTLFNDDTQQLSAQKVQWIDVDGDLVTLSVSKGQLPLANTTLFTFAESGTVGGRLLKKLDFSTFGNAFAGASVTITATKQAGFPNASDGRVDVGFIQAAVFDPDELRAFGVDLGVVAVDGDLAKITAGDSFSTPAISRLEVYSLGAHGATSLPAGETFESKVLGPISTILVKQNLEGYLHVVGSAFGTIGTLKIGGELKGGSASNSGRIAVSGRLGTATIGGITGGAGASSGLLNALLGSTASLGTITVLGDIVGGGGAVSGAIVAPRIGNVSAGSLKGGSAVQSGVILSQGTLGNITLSGDLLGSTAAQSGQITSGTSLGAVKIGGKILGGGGEDSGTILSGTSILSLSVAGTLFGGAGAGSGSVRAAVDKTGQAMGSTGNLGAVTIGEDAAHDSIKGGTGTNSGRIDVVGNLTSFTSAGNLRGGSANGSGGIVAGGNIDKLLIKRSLLGGDSTAAAFLDKSGFISALRLKSATINEDIRSGVNAGGVGGGLTNSGAIRADVIEALTVRGNLTGNSPAANRFSPVVISATGNTSNLAIKSLTVLGNAQYAEVLAGYNAATTASNFRGAEKNGDASIGTILIGGTVLGVDLVAGGKIGADLGFGTADDAAIAAASGVRNDPAIFSQIASVVIKGAILPDAANPTRNYGVVAQSLVGIKLGPTGTPVVLQAGAGNNRTPLSLGGDPHFHALELALP